MLSGPTRLCLLQYCCVATVTLTSGAVTFVHCAVTLTDTEAMLNSWTVASFDDAVTLRALGYPSPHLYYRHACSTNYIPHIRTPTLILLSKDDPFLG